MPGMPVTIGCAVVMTPGAAGPPDSGIIIAVPQVIATAGGMPLAVHDLPAVNAEQQGLSHPLT